MNEKGYTIEALVAIKNPELIQAMDMNESCKQKQFTSSRVATKYKRY